MQPTSEELHAHESAFIDAFVEPNRRDRWREMLAKPKKRKKFVAALDHTTDIDERHAIEIPPSSQTADGIIKALKDRGAPRTCYAISSNPDLDGKTIDLAEAITATLGHGFGTILSCDPGQLAYFETEEPGERVILSK